MKIIVEFLNNPKQETREITLSRVPCIGELISMKGYDYTVHTVFHKANASPDSVVAIVRVKE